MAIDIKANFIFGLQMRKPTREAEATAVSHFILAELFMRFKVLGTLKRRKFRAVELLYWVHWTRSSISDGAP
jgi:hypothetical protein